MYWQYDIFSSELNELADKEKVGLGTELHRVLIRGLDKTQVVGLNLNPIPSHLVLAGNRWWSGCMAVDVWAELAFKAGCVFESHATNTSFTPKTRPVFTNTELTCKRPQCQDFLTQVTQSVALFYTLLVIVLR